MPKSDELMSQLEDIELELREAAGERDAVRVRRLQRRKELLQQRLSRAEAMPDEEGSIMERLRDSLPLWGVLTFFVAAFGGLTRISFVDTPLKHHVASIQLLGLGGILICVLVALLALVVTGLRRFSRHLGKALRTAFAFMRQNVIFVVSVSFTIVFLILLTTVLGAGGVTALAVGLILANIGMTIGIVRIVSRHYPSAEKAHVTGTSRLVGHAVWSQGAHFFVTPNAKYRLADEATANFLSMGRGIIRDAAAQELDPFPTTASLDSVSRASLVNRRDSADYFLVFDGDDGRKYKAHMASMSMAVDFRPDLNVSHAEVWPPHQLQGCVTLR